jgi:TatD DNase family protein
MIDIHTHLYMPQFDDDREEAIKRAFDAGITMMISVSTEPSDHRQAIAIAERDERIFASVGLHPHYFNEQVSKNSQQKTVNKKQTASSGGHPDRSLSRYGGDRRISDSSATVGMTQRGVSISMQEQLVKDITELRELVQKNPKIIAIGECGLDYFSHTDEPITDDQKAWQKSGFVAQVQLAQELRLPVIIHCRDAYKDVFEILRQAQNGSAKSSRDATYILHCYMGDTEITKKFLTLPNVYFSFTGNITYPVKKILEGTKNDIQATVKLIPLERIFTETDCPFLAPVPYRGKRNEPAFTAKVAKKIADIKKCSIEYAEKKIAKSIDKVFFVF